MKNNFQNFPTHYSNGLHDSKDLNVLKAPKDSKTPFIREVERGVKPLLEAAAASSRQTALICAAVDHRYNPHLLSNTALLASGSEEHLAKLLMELSRDAKMQRVFDIFFRMYVDAHGL